MTIRSYNSPPLEIPFDAPAVSMDISLGEKYDRVDFDYDEYRNEANRLGIALDDVAGRSIRIKNPRWRDVNAGFYDIDGNKSITVSAGERTNKSISHELKHEADDEAGLSMKDTKYKVGRLGAIVLDKAAVLGMVGGAATLAGSETAERIVTSPYYLVSLGSLAVAATGYVFHPAERRARKAARSSEHQMVTFVRKAK